MQVPQVPLGCLPFGRGSSAGCEDDFEGCKGRAFSVTSGAGRSETESEGSLHDFPNLLVAVGTANAIGDVDIAGACGEHDLDGHVVDFENLQPAVCAEFGYLHCLNSMNSLICPPSMHAPSLARVIGGTSGGVCKTRTGEGVGSVLRGCGSGQLDVSLHDVIRSVPACCYPRLQGRPEYYDCSYARWSTSSKSRAVRGPEPRGGTKWSRRISLRKVRQDVGEKFAFPQQLSEKVHVETCSRGCQSPNLGISQEQEIEGRCAVVGFPPRTPFVSPVLVTLG